MRRSTREDGSPADRAPLNPYRPAHPPCTPRLGCPHAAARPREGQRARQRQATRSTSRSARRSSQAARAARRTAPRKGLGGCRSVWRSPRPVQRAMYASCCSSVPAARGLSARLAPAPSNLRSVQRAACAEGTRNVTTVHCPYLSLKPKSESKQPGLMRYGTVSTRASSYPARAIFSKN